MSLTFTVGNRTGTLPGTGDNNNQEVDTKGEAEDALSALGSDDSGTFGSKTYTRKELEGIRDRNSGGGSGNAQGEGISHGVRVAGGYAFGSGDKGHSGGQFRVGYVLGVPLLGGPDATQLYVDPSIEFTSGNRKTETTTPGGEKVISAYTPVGGLLGAAVRLVPSFFDHRFNGSAGFNFGFGGFFTSDSKTVSLPASCTPGDFGRGECEPNAGPKSGNSGTSGLMNYEMGSARGTSGTFFSFGFPITLGADVLRGTWGSLGLGAIYEPLVRFIKPDDGHGFSHWEHNLLGTATARFGGAAAYGNKAPDFDQDGVPDSQDKCPGTPIGTKVDATGCPVSLQTEPVPISPGAGDVPIPQGYTF